MLDHLLTFQITSRHDEEPFSLDTPHRVDLCNVFGYPL